MSAPFIVGIGGTARPNSTSERAVVEALRSAERLGAETRLFDGVFVSGLPLYVPDRKERTEPERDYIETMRRCDGVIVGTPGVPWKFIRTGQEHPGSARGYRPR